MAIPQVLNHINSILTRNYKQALDLGIRVALGDENAAYSSYTRHMFSPVGMSCVSCPNRAQVDDSQEKLF
jgi:hypothetical protein